MQIEYDERYGSIVCVTSPFEPIFLAIGWTLYVFDSNEIICRILYLPLAGIMTVIFGIFNLIMAPIMLLLKTGIIFSSAFEQVSVKKALIKLVEVFVFFAACPLIFLLHIVLDPLMFFLTLHVSSNQDEE